jgi:hypothetical protein
MLLILQAAQQKQERTKRSVASGRMPAPSQMPDGYAERKREIQFNHTAVARQLWCIRGMRATLKRGEGAKGILELEPWKNDWLSSPTSDKRAYRWLRVPKQLISDADVPVRERI